MINIKSIYFLSFRHIIESEHITPTVLLAKDKHSLQHKNYLLTHRRLLNNPYALCNANKEIPHLIHRVLLRIELQICFFPILTCFNFSAYQFLHLLFYFDNPNMDSAIPLDPDVVYHRPPCHFAQRNSKTLPFKVPDSLAQQFIPSDWDV